jgi:hypothetical protein
MVVWFSDRTWKMSADIRTKPFKFNISVLLRTTILLDPFSNCIGH